MFKEASIKKQRLIWPIIVTIIFVIGLFFILNIKENLYLNKVEVNLNVLNDGSIKVEEIWDIDIRDTSTLFITYPKEESNSYSFKDVQYYEDGVWKSMVYNPTISSEGKEKLNHYHVGMFEGAFELAWGTGLAEGFGNRKYKIEYTKLQTFNDKNSINNYLDTAELYHQFVGKNFEIPIKEFYAKINFESEVNKDNSKIWGHGVSTGTIFFKDKGVEVKAYDIDKRNMIEARVLFPKTFISKARINREYNGYDEILNEERYSTADTQTTGKFDVGTDISKIFFLFFYFGVYFIYLIKMNKKYKEAKNLPDENIREWEAYSGLPKTKLDILDAINIYKPISLPSFLNTIIMKLSFNKILNIIKKEEYDENKLLKNIEFQDEIFLSVLNTNGLEFNYDNVRNIINERKEYDKKETPKQTRISKKEFNNLVYIIDLKEYRERKEKGELDKDEDMILDFLISSISRAYVKNISKSPTDFTKKYTSNLKKENIDFNKDGWKKIEESFKKKIINNLDELYIEQYQILMNMFYYGEELSLNFNAENKIRKARLIDENIISIEKEKLYGSVVGISSLRWFLLFFALPGIMDFFGSIMFNRMTYIIIFSITYILEMILISFMMKVIKKTSPALTEEGLNIYYEFKGLNNFLSTTSYISEYDEKSVIIWGEFLVFATYFGITKKVLETLKKSHPEIIEEMESIDTYSSMSNAINHYSTFSSVTTSTYTTASSSASSGSGGGFSSGGGGRRRWWPVVVEDNTII